MPFTRTPIAPPVPRLPTKPTPCTCSTAKGKGIFDCQRPAVVVVGRQGFCTQHATTRGIAIPVAPVGVA